MSTNLLHPAFVGEKLAGIEPSMRRFVDGAPTRRQFVAGRHLTDDNLSGEQDAHIARLLGRVRSLTEGVVDGLEAQLSAGKLSITAGRGLTTNGEDVVLRGSHSLAWSQVRVLVDFDDSGTITPDDWGWRDSGGPPSLWGNTVARQKELNAPAPGAGVLLLKPCKVVESQMPPILNKVAGVPQPTEFVGSRSDSPYERQRWVDAVAVCLYPVPNEWLANGQGALERHAQAWKIFQSELTKSPPWLAHGVPIALVGIGNDFEPHWLDRNAVVRGGGLPRPLALMAKPHGAPPVVQPYGEPRLWNARILQAMEMLAEAFSKPDADAQKIGAELRMLPPAGLLPFGGVVTKAISQTPLTLARPLATRRSMALFESESSFVPIQSFFPQTWAVDVVPVPEEDLSAVFADAQSLAPFDLNHGVDRVRLLLPVAQNYFDPALLQIETVPAKLMEQAAVLRDRAKGLASRREELRAKEATLAFALDGKAPVTFVPELDSMREPAFDTKTELGKLVSTDLFKFQEGFRTTFTPRWGDPEREFKELPTLIAKQKDIATAEREQFERVCDPLKPNRIGLVQFASYLTDRISGAHSVLETHFLRTQVQVRSLNQVMSNNGSASQLALSPSLSPSLEIDQLGTLDKSKVNSFGVQILTRADAKRAIQGQTPVPEQPPPAPAGPNNPIGRNLGGGPANAALNPRLGRAILPREKIDELKAALNGSAGAEMMTAKFTPPALSLLLADIGLPRFNPPVPDKWVNDVDGARTEIFEGLQHLDISLGGSLVTDFKQQSLADLLKGKDKPTLPKEPDDTDHFDLAVKLSDSTIAALRTIDRRIGDYRKQLEACLAAIAAIRQTLVIVAPHREVAERAYDEAAHDVAVADSIIAEEKERVERINARRRAVLMNHVRQVVFTRVRITNTWAGLPSYPLDSALAQPPTLTCVNDPTLIVAPELDEMRAVLRAAPLRWFARSAEWLKLGGSYHPLRAMFNLPTTFTNIMALREGAASMQTMMCGTFLRSLALIERWARPLPRLDHLGSLLDLIREGRETWTLGELIDRGPQRVSEAAALELNSMLKVAACMHHAFGEASATARMEWAQRFSEFDQGYDYRRIEGLPHWPQLRPTLRQRLSAESAWLFSRIDATHEDAVELINGLIRVAMLLSAHAPVRRVIAGSLAETVEAQPGRQIRLVVADAMFVRVGMVATLSYENLQARCVVEDIGPGVVTARVSTLSPGSPRFPVSTKVEFSGGLVR